MRRTKKERKLELGNGKQYLTITSPTFSTVSIRRSTSPSPFKSPPSLPVLQPQSLTFSRHTSSITLISHSAHTRLLLPPSTAMPAAAKLLLFLPTHATAVTFTLIGRLMAARQHYLLPSRLTLLQSARAPQFQTCCYQCFIPLAP